MDITDLNGKKLVLGSASAGRKQLLQKWGWEFEVVTADIDEKAIRSDDPEELTLSLAAAKADVVVPLVEGPALIVTSDTVMHHMGEIIEKPNDEKEVRRLLGKYREAPVYTFTAVVVSDNLSGKRVKGVESTKVAFSEIPEEVIEKLAAKEETYQRAGGFTTEESIIRPYMREIKGEEETVIGLPKTLTEQLINRVK